MATMPQRDSDLDRLLGTVSEAMTTNVILLAADIPARVALRHLENRAVSGAPVVDHGRVVGVVTQRDLRVPILVGHVAGSGDGDFPEHVDRLAGLRVRDLMSDEPVTAQRDWSLLRSVRVMVDRGVNRLPAVDQQRRPLGILTRDDVLRALIRRAGPSSSVAGPPATDAD